MNRRELIALLGTTAAMWPVGARAQQSPTLRRIGVLNMFAADDPEGQARIAALLQALQPLGWTVGRNLRIDYRWGTSNIATTHKNATELVALAPDVIVTNGAAGVAPLLEATPTVPIVFVLVGDPVGAGFVDSLARPGVKEIAPGMTRAAVIRDPAITVGIGMFGAIQSAAPSLGVEVNPVNVRDASEMERAVGAFARSGNGGLIVTPSPLAYAHRDLILALATRHKLPAVYFARTFVLAGGLACYGPDPIDQYQRAAAYVDRILKGEKPADLPVQAPTKYELVINLKTAKLLGLELPATVLARADEVIE